MALDKTGTLTEGKPKLVAWEALGASADAAAAEHIAAALAGHSEHPVSRAIAAGLRPSSVEAGGGARSVSAAATTARAREPQERGRR